MMRKSRTILLCAAAALAVVSCQRAPDYSAKITQLDQALVRVDSAALVFETIDRQSGVELAASIDADVKYIAERYHKDMQKETAMLVSQYKSTANIIKDWGSRHRRVTKELERTNHQLNNLKAALEIGATEDSEGNPFTDEYVERAFAQEVTVAEHLVEEILDMEERLGRAHKVHDSMKAQIDAVIATLPE